MLRTRVITAIIGFIVAFIFIMAGGYYYDVGILLLALGAWREYGKMTHHSSYMRLTDWWGLLSIVATMVCLALHKYVPYAWSFTVIVWAVIVLGLLFIASRTITLKEMATSLFGYFYIMSGFSALMMVRDNSLYSLLHVQADVVQPGLYMVWLLLFSTWASDTFAYFVGRAIGKHHIVPHISPNKTSEGFIGGFIGCLVISAIYAYVTGYSMQIALAIGLITGIFAPLGDLFESKIKRICEVKDSGMLLPGHGGILDRFDSLLFTATITMIYLLHM